MPTISSTTTMRAMVQDGYGDADILRSDQVAQPTIGRDEVRVRVHAAGLNRANWHLMTGKPYALRPVFGLRSLRQPVIGNELAGTVVSVGSEVTRFAPGDEVYGTGSGTFAEFAAAPEDKLARKPANLTFEEAAIVPDSAATALQAIVGAGRLEAGQRVLVTGASGGVGSFAVQIAKALGAHVTAECSTGKVDMVRSLGADEVLDYTVDDFADGSRQFDLIVDIAGSPSLPRLRRALTPTGTVVIVGGEGGGNLLGIGRQLRAVLISPFVKQRLIMFILKAGAEDLEQLTAMIEAGQVSPALERTYPLEQAPDAMRRLIAVDVHGKIAISIGTA